jgi:hypothetical protein
VRIGGEVRRLPMVEGRGLLTVPAGAEVAVDPHGWVLRGR